MNPQQPSLNMLTFFAYIGLLTVCCAGAVAGVWTYHALKDWWTDRHQRGQRKAASRTYLCMEHAVRGLVGEMDRWIGGETEAGLLLAEIRDCYMGRSSGHIDMFAFRKRYEELRRKAEKVVTNAWVSPVPVRELVTSPKEDYETRAPKDIADEFGRWVADHCSYQVHIRTIERANADFTTGDHIAIAELVAAQLRLILGVEEPKS